MSISLTTVGKFRETYRALARARSSSGAPLIDSTPVILSEGDSWFATPLYPNLMDGVAHAVQGLFLRVERPGDTAVTMFARANTARLIDHLRTFRFDVMLLSAGGNDFVDEFLARTFRGAGAMTPTQALARVAATGLYEKVRRAYQGFIDRAARASPETRFIVHTYAYPRLLGVPAHPTVTQLGLIALFKRSFGDWIARHIVTALPARGDQVIFVRGLVDRFHDEVLSGLTDADIRIVDLRDEIADDTLWNDEMHPTAAGFEQLAPRLVAAVRNALPPAKRAAVAASPAR
jgi:lysophospholipase L1-like esterase